MTGTTQLKIQKPFDRHIHARQGEVSKMVISDLVNQKMRGAVIMPNTHPPVVVSAQAESYRQSLRSHCERAGSNKLELFMTAYLTESTDVRDLLLGYDLGRWGAAKYYPTNNKGEGTTGSQNGITDLEKIYHVLEAMEEKGMPLLAHIESAKEGVDEFEREIRGIEEILLPIRLRFPELKIVMEHVTDGRSVDIVEETPNLFGTITVHHMALNRNALFQGGLNPGNWCKPVLKSKWHQEKVVAAATSGSGKFGAGTDAAPHDLLSKSKCYGCPPGIYSGYNSISLYTALFEEAGGLEFLEGFLSRNFIWIYGLKPTTEKITIKKGDPQLIPHKRGTVPTVPLLFAGEQVSWTVQ